MKFFVPVIAAGALVLGTAPADALIGCQGIVTQTQVRADGGFYAVWGWGWKLVCNLSADTSVPSFAVKKDACTGLMSLFVTAQTSGLSIASFHSTSTTCTQALGANEMPNEQPYGYLMQK